MEIHAHTHTPRKKWTHYFWEFFMLFLAVIGKICRANHSCALEKIITFPVNKKAKPYIAATFSVTKNFLLCKKL